MTTRPLHALIPALLMGCETTSTDDTTSATEGDGRVELSLSLDGLTVGAGSCSNFKEVQSPARAGSTETDPACGAAVELYDGSCWGVFPARPTFASLEVGAASAMLDPLLLVWSGSDPEASWDLATDQWRGSMKIVERRRPMKPMPIRWKAVSSSPT